MTAFATHIRWTLALCGAGVAVAAVVPAVDKGAVTLGTVLLAEVVAGLAWVASRLSRRDLSGRAQLVWLTGGRTGLAARVGGDRRW